jgi:hypothetical protein
MFTPDGEAVPSGFVMGAGFHGSGIPVTLFVFDVPKGSVS